MKTLTRNTILGIMLVTIGMNGCKEQSDKTKPTGDITQTDETQPTGDITQTDRTKPTSDTGGTKTLQGTWSGEWKQAIGASRVVEVQFDADYCTRRTIYPRNRESIERFEYEIIKPNKIRVSRISLANKEPNREPVEIKKPLSATWTYAKEMITIQPQCGGEYQLKKQ